MKATLRRLGNRVRRKGATLRRRLFPEDRSVMIGSCRLELPGDMLIKRLYTHNPTYDFVHWNIIGEVLSENAITDAQLIDVGANVGDTIAHFRRISDGRAIGVEAQPHFHAMMKRNFARDSAVAPICALVCPDARKGDITLLGGSATGGTALRPGAGTYAGPTISCPTLLDMLDGSIVFKTDTDGFDDTILMDLLDAVDAGHRAPAVISFEGPTHTQIKTQDYDGYLAAIQRMCDMGYRVLVLSNIGVPLANVGTDADQAAWHLRSLTDAVRHGQQYCHYFDYIAVAPDLSCMTFDMADRAMRDRIWSNIYRA